MERLIQYKMRVWKDSDRRKPLIIRGARQVGKTYTIKEFGKKYFQHTVVIDFEKERNIRTIFENSLEPQKIIQSLELITKKPIIPGKSLLFFDEIQACPDAIIALRYFYEEMKELHVIAAGSLLEFSISEISFPVGRIQFLNMYPLNFQEFLLATGNDKAATLISNVSMDINEWEHDILLRELRTYFFIGGMPESVKAFRETASILESHEIHKELLQSFREDFSKYAPQSDKQCIEDVFYNSAKNIGNQIKYTNLSDSFSSPTVKKALETLIKAKLITKVPSIHSLEPPLNSQINHKKFKIILLDIGLWQQLGGILPAHEILETNLSNLYRGALAEQFVGQELLVGFNELRYWYKDKKSSNAEVDYILEKENQAIPIEVKSGSAGSLKSLHQLFELNPETPYSIVFSSRLPGLIAEKKIIFLPLYFAGAIQNAQFSLKPK
ncbi:MAG: ATP-binding protein [Leptospiraceae bacterium]|nr:ATP-binding protein [Leptospiraceae bacterium]